MIFFFQKPLHCYRAMTQELFHTLKHMPTLSVSLWMSIWMSVSKYVYECALLDIHENILTCGLSFISLHFGQQIILKCHPFCIPKTWAYCFFKTAHSSNTEFIVILTILILIWDELQNKLCMLQNCIFQTLYIFSFSLNVLSQLPLSSTLLIGSSHLFSIFFLK